MFENPRRQASKKFYNKCFENSRSQIVFRTDILPKIVVGSALSTGLYSLLNARDASRNVSSYEELARRNI